MRSASAHALWRVAASGFGALCLIIVCVTSLPASQSDIDGFMETVLERRDENRAQLAGYVLDEREVFQLIGPAGSSLQGFDREYAWYARDGYLIRSPVRFNGVEVGEAERRAFEDDWLRQERRRAENSEGGGGRRRRVSIWSGGDVSTRDSFDNIMITIERQWGRRVSDQLGRDLAEDAALWHDDAAAIVAGIDRIVADLGGVATVGIDMVVTRLREAFVMLETQRLESAQVGRLLSAMLPVVSDTLSVATGPDLDRYVELVELAVRFGLRLPEIDPALGWAEAVLHDRRAPDLAHRLAAAREALASAAGDSTSQFRRDANSAPDTQLGIGLQPRFVSESYFLDFAFEPGNYYFAGPDQVAGRDVVQIEYYPQQLFSDTDGTDRDSRGQRVDAGFDKTSLVTLWIDPDHYQIVKFTFDNVGFDFLPMRWLVRLDDLTASMVMGQPFDGVWLPERVDLNGRVTLATGTFTVAYSRVFSNYRQADVRSRIRSYATPQE